MSAFWLKKKNALSRTLSFFLLFFFFFIFFLFLFFFFFAYLHLSISSAFALLLVLAFCPQFSKHFNELYPEQFYFTLINVKISV